MVPTEKNQSEDALAQKIFTNVQKFNILIRDSIEGPNCIDPTICHGDCCFVHLDIPRALAELYIRNGWATREDFQRGITLSFEVKMDLDTLKCPFFDKILNGCSLHSTGMKIPHCWIYPTGLDPNDCHSHCKRADTWKIIQPEKVIQANQILTNYMEFCNQEAKIEKSSSKCIMRFNNLAYHEFKKYKPTQVAGIKDDWDSWHILAGEGWQLGLKPKCDQIECQESFFSCPSICKSLFDQLKEEINNNLATVLRILGYKTELLFGELLNPSTM